MVTRLDFKHAPNLLSAWYSKWSPRFTMPIIVFNSLSFHFVRLVRNQIKGELVKNQEYYMPIHQSDHNIGLNNYISTNHFPIGVSDDSCFTFVDPVMEFFFMVHYFTTQMLVKKRHFSFPRWLYKVLKILINFLNMVGSNFPHKILFTI